jgi:septal ring factor EnvC (AmiA/AmiB activator)
MASFVFRKNGQRAIEELQRTVIEIESKYKAELNRVKKKYDQQIADYEHQLDTLSRSNAELARANKALAARIKVTCTIYTCSLIVCIQLCARSRMGVEA